MNTGLHVSLSILVSSVCMPSSGIAVFYFQCLKEFKAFKEISTLFSIVAVLVCISTNSVRGFPFLHPLQHCRLFDGSHFDQREMVTHCGFDLHFSDNERCWASFHVFVSHLYVCLLWRNVCLVLWPAFSLGHLFFWYWATWAACKFWR